MYKENLDKGVCRTRTRRKIYTSSGTESSMTYGSIGTKLLHDLPWSVVRIDTICSPGVPSTYHSDGPINTLGILQKCHGSFLPSTDYCMSSHSSIGYVAPHSMADSSTYIPISHFVSIHNLHIHVTMTCPPTWIACPFSTKRESTNGKSGSGGGGLQQAIVWHKYTVIKLWYDHVLHFPHSVSFNVRNISDIENP